MAEQPKIRPDSHPICDSKKPKTTIVKPMIKPYILLLSFSQRQRKNNTYKQFVQFINMFKKLHINISFAEALAQMPKYAKFMKDILQKKRNLEEHEMVMLNEECSPILQNKYLLS